MKIAIIGLGFVGLSLTSVLASKGYDIIGIDIDKEKCSKISNGITPFFEPELEKTLKNGLKKKLKISDNFSLISNCDFIFVTVGTPQNANGSIDLSIIKKAISSIGENLSESKSENLIHFSNIQIIRDEQWDLKMLLSKIQEKKTSLFLDSTKKALVESQLALSKAKQALEQDDPFASCWIKCAALFLIDSVLLQNQILPIPANALSSMRNFKEKNTNQFADKIILETGTERATSSLLSRMIKSSIGFSDMIENNQNSIIIEKKGNYLIQNSLFSDCYLYLSYQNRKNFYKIKDSLNKNSDKIHVLKTAFDLTNISELSVSIDSISSITNALLTSKH